MEEVWITKAFRCAEKEAAELRREGFIHGASEDGRPGVKTASRRAFAAEAIRWQIAPVRLYVGNLAKDVTEQDLSELFAGAGTVAGISLVIDRATGHTRGFGFVEMGSDADGERALERFNGYTLKGRPLVVNEARPPQSRE